MFMHVQRMINEIVPDEPDRMRPLILQYAAEGEVDALLMTGGTGISPRVFPPGGTGCST